MVQVFTTSYQCLGRKKGLLPSPCFLGSACVLSVCSHAQKRQFLPGGMAEFGFSFSIIDQSLCKSLSIRGCQKQWSRLLFPTQKVPWVPAPQALALDPRHSHSHEHIFLVFKESPLPVSKFQWFPPLVFIPLVLSMTAASSNCYLSDTWVFSHWLSSYFMNNFMSS